jgi:hypothetical protein
MVLVEVNGYKIKNMSIHNYIFSELPHMPWKPKRDFIFIDRYLDELEQDIYPQPPDIENIQSYPKR